MLCRGRLVVGVGRGAFAYEMGRLGAPIATSRDRFTETLEILRELLAREDASWDGRHYTFEPITVMPRPVRQVPFMIAALAPEAIAASAARGFHIQTPPLGGSHTQLLGQVEAFRRGTERWDGPLAPGAHARRLRRPRRGRRPPRPRPGERVLQAFRQRLQRPGHGHRRDDQSAAPPPNPRGAGREPRDLPACRDGATPARIRRGG